MNFVSKFRLKLPIDLDRITGKFKNSLFADHFFLAHVYACVCTCVYACERVGGSTLLDIF